jgi:DNA-directed RNA polymerase specialized sigma24 family protein
MTGARSDAEDALVRAWRAIDGFEARASMRTWLYRVTTNACLDLIREPDIRRATAVPSRSCITAIGD